MYNRFPSGTITDTLKSLEFAIDDLGFSGFGLQQRLGSQLPVFSVFE